MFSLKSRWILFTIGSLIAISIPVSTIWKHSKILTEGETVKIKLEPIDPYDPFRGRYVRLDFDLGRATWDTVRDVEAPHRVAKAYLSYELDSAGFAKAKTLHETPPSDTPYLIVQDVRYHSFRDTWRFDLPFDRYYLNEKDAPLAEEIARETLQARDSQREDSYIVIRTLDGNAAIDSLYLGQVKIEDRLKQVRAERAVEK